jgi:hypothetical protein
MSYTTITQSVVAPAVTALTISSTASVTVNAALGNDFRLALTKTASIANPTGAVDGQRITFQITQGGTGGFKVTWGSQYKFGTSGTPALTTEAGATDVLGFIYNAALGHWLCVGTALGF